MTSRLFSAKNNIMQKFVFLQIIFTMTDYFRYVEFLVEMEQSELLSSEFLSE